MDEQRLPFALSAEDHHFLVTLALGETPPAMTAQQQLRLMRDGLLEDADDCSVATQKAIRLIFGVDPHELPATLGGLHQQHSCCCN